MRESPFIVPSLGIPSLICFALLPFPFLYFCFCFYFFFLFSRRENSIGSRVLPTPFLPLLPIGILPTFSLVFSPIWRIPKSEREKTRKNETKKEGKQASKQASKQVKQSRYGIKRSDKRDEEKVITSFHHFVIKEMKK
jgi:hypothetical protein